MTVMENIIPRIMAFFKNVYQREARVLGIINEGELWRIKVQIIEEDEYMAKRGKKDLLGIYEVLMDQALEIVGYELVTMKERGTV